ncbi:MAG: NADH-quinone oxidoreductase subunit L [Candidatus Dormibacteraceae bacterium]
MQQWLTLSILLLPAAGALLLALFGRRLPLLGVQLIGPGVIWLAFLCVLWLFYASLKGDPAHDFIYWSWISSGNFQIPFDLLVDRLSLFMGLIITGVGGLIVTYSVGYMAEEDGPSYARFFCYMDLFLLSMLLLVLAGNLLFLIVGWAAVGLSSYLLIGFWYWRHAAVVAARKAFVMNVIGDIGMILAAFILFLNFHQLGYSGLFASLPHSDSWQLELAAALLLVGAVAKSAQLPLHTWLPDAMEGPTPVSALIHAATMVTAGVYLVGRMHPLYDLTTWAHSAVAVIGAVTALFAATIAIVQVDIKKVLAYSTMSQIGYMFLAVGVGAYSAGFFHLMAHALFKALLFMAAGNVIHAVANEQDIRRYGGLWKQLRGSSLCFLIGSLSLAGIFPLVGFFSKEMVLGDVFSHPDPNGLFTVLWAVGFITALLTGFYTGRLWWIAFIRPRAVDRPVDHPHEAPVVMLIPVIILTVLTTVGGFLQISAIYHQGWQLISDFLRPAVGEIGWAAGSSEYVVTGITLVFSVITFCGAYFFFIRPRRRPWPTPFPLIQQVLEQKYYFDQFYDILFVRPMNGLATFVQRYLEVPVIEGSGLALSSITQTAARNVARSQSGYFRRYALLFIIGTVVVIVIVLLLRSVIG